MGSSGQIAGSVPCQAPVVISVSNGRGGRPVAYKPNEMKAVNWTVTGRTGVLGIDDGTRTHRFSGFREAVCHPHANELVPS